MTALARAEGVRPQSMGATVSVLRAAGPVSGAPDPTNGRQTILSLTASAWNAFTAGRAIREDWLFSAIRSNLAPDEQERYCQKHRTAQAAGRSTARPRIQYQDRATAPLSG